MRLRATVRLGGGKRRRSLAGRQICESKEWNKRSRSRKGNEAMAKNSPATLKARNEKRAYWKRKIDPSSFPHTIVKWCISCNEMKECNWAATFTQSGHPEYRSRCVECQKK